MADLQFATVTDDSPLTVQIKGDETGTPAQKKDADLPALVVNDLVMVTVIDRMVIVMMKVADA